MSNGGAICDLVNSRKRVRRQCPYHQHLCYGELAESYDTVRVFFDCGTWIDYEYREWSPPPKNKKGGE